MGLTFAQGEPPEFSLSVLVQAAMQDSHARGLSPVRYLRLDGDVPLAPLPRRWRPSSLDRCQRAQVYGATDTPREPLALDEAQQFTFDRGHVLGAWLAAYLYAARGVAVQHVEAERVCLAEDLRYGGRCDVFLEVGGHGYVVECKSKESPEALDKIRAPEREHVRQLNDYLAMLGARAGWVAYFGFYELEVAGRKRMTVRLRDFFHRFDSKLWEATRARIATCEWFFDDRTRLAPRTSNVWMECPSCPWRARCDANGLPGGT